MLATPVCAVRDGQERKQAIELLLTGYLILCVMNKRRQKKNTKKPASFLLRCLFIRGRWSVPQAFIPFSVLSPFQKGRGGLFRAVCAVFLLHGRALHTRGGSGPPAAPPEGPGAARSRLSAASGEGQLLAPSGRRRGRAGCRGPGAEGWGQRHGQVGTGGPAVDRGGARGRHQRQQLALVSGGARPGRGRRPRGWGGRVGPWGPVTERPASPQDGAGCLQLVHGAAEGPAAARAGGGRGGGLRGDRSEQAGRGGLHQQPQGEAHLLLRVGDQAGVDRWVAASPASRPGLRGRLRVPASLGIAVTRSAASWCAVTVLAERPQ